MRMRQSDQVVEPVSMLNAYIHGVKFAKYVKLDIKTKEIFKE